MASDIENHLFEAEDAQGLVNQGQLSPVLNGKRKISSASFLTTPYSFTSAPSPSSTSVSITTTDVVYEIPVSLRSKEAFEFLGLTPTTAARLWNEWVDVPTDFKSPEGPISFLDMVTDYIGHQEPDATSCSDDWENTMRGWGLTEEFICAIMAPEPADLRMTESAIAWTIDTVLLRWRALEAIQDGSQERQRKKYGRGKAGGGYDAKQGGAGMSLRGGGEEEPTGGEKPSGGKPSATGIGYTLLWRGQDLKWLEGMIDAQGNRHFNKMYSLIPSDFQGIQGNVLSFTPERRTAEIYAQYAKKRCGCSRVGLVWMKVPNELISRNEPVILQYGDDWKKIVFASRRRENFPKELKALQRRSIFIGHICRNDHVAIARLYSWRDISAERNAMLIKEPIWDLERKEWNTETRRVTQYVFNGADVREELEEEATFGIIGMDDKSPLFVENGGGEV